MSSESKYVIASLHSMQHGPVDIFTVVFQTRVDISNHASLAEARAAVSRLEAADAHARAVVETARQPKPGARVVTITEVYDHPHEIPGPDFEPSGEPDDGDSYHAKF
jgi:hypothetical protein